jgi:hypothetical protein
MKLSFIQFLNELEEKEEPKQAGFMQSIGSVMGINPKRMSKVIGDMPYVVSGLKQNGETVSSGAITVKPRKSGMKGDNIGSMDISWTPDKSETPVVYHGKDRRIWNIKKQSPIKGRVSQKGANFMLSQGFSSSGGSSGLGAPSGGMGELK